MKGRGVLKRRQKIDLTIVIPIVLFFIISITTIYSAMTYLSPDNGNLALKQAIWYLVGVILIVILLNLRMTICIGMLGFSIL